MLTQGHMVLTKNEQGRILSMGATLCPIDFSIGHTAHQHVVVPLGLCYMQPPASSSTVSNVCNMPVWPDTMFKKALDIMGTPVLHTTLSEEPAEDVKEDVKDAVDEPAEDVKENVKDAVEDVKDAAEEPAEDVKEPAIRHVKRMTRRRKHTALRTKRVLTKDKPTRSG
jgi:hypothetical protein